MVSQLFEEFPDPSFRCRGWQSDNFDTVDRVEINTTVKELHGANPTLLLWPGSGMETEDDLFCERVLAAPRALELVSRVLLK